MYRKRDREQITIDDFIVPFGGKLRADNRWVKLSKVIPWDKIEDRYAEKFGKCGNVAIPLRMALGALIIKEKCGFSDEETVENISENNYMQYFIGYKEYRAENPFVPSLMVEFRKRLDLAEIQRIIDDVDDENKGAGAAGESRPGEPEPDNNGSLLIDATCAPADIKYPTDLTLLNEGREKLEEIIDAIWENIPEKPKVKPRTHREEARKAFLGVEKRRRRGHKIIRKAIGKQLRYIRRDLDIIAYMLENSQLLDALTPRQYRNLLVIAELYRQQEEMYRSKKHSVDDRIVSISQPHVRPIVRGKASAEVEFGAKVAVSKVNGVYRIETLSWDNFNEGTELIGAIERYKTRHGFYPKAVLADKLYRNRDNLAFCKKYGIRLSGPPLGRPKRDLTADKRIERMDAAERNEIEGGFGTGKRAYGLGRIMAKLRQTSETVIAMPFLMMNLDYKARVYSCLLLRWAQGRVSKWFSTHIRYLLMPVFQ
jgi:IS5 family transposase